MPPRPRFCCNQSISATKAWPMYATLDAYERIKMFKELRRDFCTLQRGEYTGGPTYHSSAAAVAVATDYRPTGGPTEAVQRSPAAGG